MAMPVTRSPAMCKEAREISRSPEMAEAARGAPIRPIPTMRAAKCAKRERSAEECPSVIVKTMGMSKNGFLNATRVDVCLEELARRVDSVTMDLSVARRLGGVHGRGYNESMSKKRFCWPPIVIRVNLGAPQLFKGAGLPQPQPKSLRLKWSAESVAKMMESIGWDSLDPGQADRAVRSMEDLAEAALEQTARACGYAAIVSFSMREAFQSVAEDWALRLEGGGWEDRDQLEFSATLRFEPAQDLYHADPGPRAAARLCSEHECAAKTWAETFHDFWERLGAPAQVVGVSGFSASIRAASALPAIWRWPPHGAALFVMFEGGAAACARLSPSGIKSLAESPLGRAGGPHGALQLQGCRKELRLTLSAGRPVKFYSSHALRQGDTMGEHFPIQGFDARSKWRTELAASPDEVFSALRALHPGRALASLDFCEADGAEVMPGMYEPAVSRWLGGERARREAALISRAAGPLTPSRRPARRI